MSKLSRPISLKTAFIAVAAVAMAAAPSFAQSQEDTAPSLAWPLSCTLFQDCFIGNYPDLKIGTDPVFPVDYKCGQRTRSGASGVEVVYTDRKTALEGQTVLAAADGRVTFVENDIDDKRQYSKSSKRACGNHVVLRHSPSYSTKYCYMRKGSVLLKPGQKVDQGDVLGQVGSSGATEAPMLYFEVTKNGTPVDPFSGRELNRASECFSLNDKPLWASAYPYPPAGVIAGSFAQGYPTAHDVAYDATITQKLPRTLRTLSAWVRVFGIVKGDKETLKIYKPNGQVWHETERVHFADAPFWTAFASATFKPETWAEAGEWKAAYTLQREGEQLMHYDFFVTIQ